MFELIGRENAIFEMLQKLKNTKLPFILVGGYAISAYKHRFSVDADIVIKKENLKEFEKILKENKFSMTVSKKLENVYASFVRYENKQKVSFDLLVNGVAVRQTGALFDFKLLMENSEEREVIGTEKSLFLMVPRKEALIAMKAHSGRLTDFRDIAALAYDIDHQILKKLISTGNTAIIKSNLKKLAEILEKKDFIDSFKGVFSEKKFIDTGEIKKVCRIFSKN